MLSSLPLSVFLYIDNLHLGQFHNAPVKAVPWFIFIEPLHSLNFKNDRILDIGCAGGALLLYAAHQGAGNLYGMLMYSVGLDPTNDPTFTQEENAVQCYTERFGDGEYLADFRSPHNSSNNIGYCHNVYHEYFKKYFTLGQQIIVVNLNGTDFQDRHNGLTYWASVQKCA